MLSVAEARARILARLVSTEAEPVLLDGCAGRVLAQDLVANTDLPLFDNSAMDGFALRAGDTDRGGEPPALRVVGDIRAGDAPSFALAPGEACRIMTGAPLPKGADAVIPVEDTDIGIRAPGATAPASVTPRRSVRRGDFVRGRGQDVKQGQTVFQRGHRLRAQDAGLLAMLGMSRIAVHGIPRIALISSGDELVEPSVPLQPGMIRDSNTYMLGALVESAGARAQAFGIARDAPGAMEDLLAQAVGAGVHLIVSSAGVSVGAFDFVRSAVVANGSLDFWKVNMRPGKPLAFGENGGVPFIGLPGNPVSAFVGFEVFVRPAIDRLAGLPDVPRQRVRVVAAESIESDGRESYLRAVVKQEGDTLMAHLTGHQGSGNLLSLVQANALLIVPAGVECVPANRELDAWIL